MIIKTNLWEIYGTPDGKRATLRAYSDGGKDVWEMRVFNADGTLNHGGNYGTRRGAMVAMSRGQTHKLTFLGMTRDFERGEDNEQATNPGDDDQRRIV